MEEEDDFWDNYESGPYCPHWCEYGEGCDIKCASCGITCEKHWSDEMACDEWIEPEYSSS